MNTADAAYAVAHDYPGGTDSLAPRIGMSGALLRNKVNQNQTINHLTLAEAVRMTEITGDTRIVEAFARQLGMMLMDIPAAENCADGEVIEMLSESMKTFGEVGHEVNRTFADGRVEQHEVRRVRDAIWSHLGKLFGLSNRIEGMAEK